MSWLTDPLGYDFVLLALAEVIVMGATCGAISVVSCSGLNSNECWQA